jgi:hypothetical protein
VAYLKSLECLCIKAHSPKDGSLYTAGAIKTKLSANPANIKAKVVAAGSIASSIIRLKYVSVNDEENEKRCRAVASISSKLSASGARMQCTGLVGTAQIDPGLTASYSVNQKLDISGVLAATYTDKFAGDFGDYECNQKLFPISDIPIVPSLNSFVGPLNESSDLYTFIDEGVFTGDYDKKFGHSILIADDKTSYIHPSAIHTDGQFEYQCGVTTPLVRPEHTRLRIRASAPLTNYEAKTAPQYTIEDIKFEDPEGNLIVQYDDIILRGDADYNNQNYVNFTTYSSNSKINTTELYGWQSGYPLLQDDGVYTLYFKVTTQALDDAFDPGFDPGFEENYILPESIISDPTNTIRISALEICNSGGYGPRIEDKTNLYMEVRSTGHRIERSIYPSFVPVTSFDTNIYPLASSVWYANDNPAFSNETASGALKVLESLNNPSEHRFITLNSTDFADSGKLTLKMSHDGSDTLNEVTNGDFNYAFSSGIAGTCVANGAFNREKRNYTNINDGFFIVDCVTLKVLAKKRLGSRDYTLDVVGYSNDKILNVTSAVGGFLQNISGVGDYPVSSGFAGDDDLGISSLAISENDQYWYEASGNNTGNDHYSLAGYPVVSGTDFAWYDVPLKVYDDTVTLGKSRDYTMSSLFENMYLDIFPLPSGATIANIYLSVRYKPQNALNMITQGGEDVGQISNGKSEGKLYPISRQANDAIINAGSGYAPLSSISDIPHAYTTPTTIKSNYSRRWRGMEGTVNGGPFDVEQFSFSFYNPPLDFPFLSGFYDFDYDRGLDIIPRVGNLTGTLTTSYSDYRFKNIGWRHTTNDLFADQLPGYTGAYQTTDWSSLSNGGDNFETHPLYGQIADAFNNVVRISGQNSYINFGDIDIVPDSGFSMYVRFSPDANVSGVGYDLFESGCLFSKWDTGNDLEFALGYASGFLRGYARDNVGVVHTVQDPAICSGYQYPLSVILTYNDDNTSGLKLYTDNEFEPNWNTLRASSVAPFHMGVGNSDFVIGNSTGSGVGFNMFVSEIGISNSGNIVYSDPDATCQQVTAQKFLENNRVFWWDDSDTYSDDSYKLWDYVDEGTHDDWTLGDFKYCAFDIDFDQLQKRTGRDLISFNMVHDGSGYAQRTNLALPTNLDSGVAYHTQFENDFLRFNLSDTADNFYSAFRRITKDLPRGYKFADRALVVETVLEHSTDYDINWDDGKVGPKLIVSLYTKNQDPYWTPDEPNWGLINRAIHYLEPSSCFMRVDSKFTHDSICDQTEEWALFPPSRTTTELEEKYFSQDVDDMFLQYDLVYPSGPAFESRIDIHTAHVRMDDAYAYLTDESGVLSLATSGGLWEDDNLNLSTSGSFIPDSGILWLHTKGPSGIQDSGFYLYTSGAFRVPESLNLFAKPTFTVVSESGFTLAISGSSYDFIENNERLNLSIVGKATVTSHGGDYVGMALTALNTDTSNLPDGGLLDLFTFGSTVGSTGLGVDMPIFMLNEHQIRGGGGGAGNESGFPSGALNLQTVGSPGLSSKYRRNAMNLALFNNDPFPESNIMNLTLYGDELDYLNITELTGIGSSWSGYGDSPNMSLYIANYGGTGSDYMRWSNENYGVNIDVADNPHASKLASDEIRGVDLIGYGSCVGNSPDKAIDKAIVTDGIVWREETCNEGGIFRAEETYTNLEAGYNNEYYDIRKYESLIPNSPYLATLKVTTGSTDPIAMPRDWEEWEYGTSGTVNFSAVKLTADEPRSLLPSGRNPGDKYGKAVSVDNDLMAVSSPFIEIPDDSGHAINSAGSVFLYRRNADVPGKQAEWSFENKLMLPDGYRRDYKGKVIGNLLCYPSPQNPEFCVSGQRWHIGQEGREFGHSVDLSSNSDGETIVVGAPGAQWKRTFDTTVVSGIPVCMMVFVDKFTYDEPDLGQIFNIANKYDVLYRHFSAPWNAATDPFQTALDIKILVFEMADSNPFPNSVITGMSDEFKHTYIHHVKDQDLIDAYVDAGNTAPQASGIIEAGMLSDIQKSFDDMFPHSNELHSGIPPIVGIFRDTSATTNFGLKFGSAIDDFMTYYYDYSYQSGVVNSETMTADSGYIQISGGDSDNFASFTKDLLNNTLSTGNLINAERLGVPHDASKYITSGIGQEWANSNAYEFQIPPGSGGRVYIFEKENGAFNLVQSIKSNTESNLELTFNQTGDEDDYAYSSKRPDRFGHSVSISDNREVIAVGSPYTNASCQVFERDTSENARMYDNLSGWLTFRSKTAELSRYDDLVIDSNVTTARNTVYHELSQGDKFLLRTDALFWGNNPIELYKSVYTYGYGNIPYTGTWAFIPGTFAGTSRLGYSTAVSEDGDTVAFGAPTDSFNEFDDTNVWYKHGDTWASYTNAGAVRTFGSRKNYPHSGVVEFYKFGNLDRSLHPDLVADGHYDQMGLYFAPKGKSFQRTQFEDLEIPQGAGLAFIITPEIDAASDEVVDNIKNWLALGDRTLVIVGNDPVWEASGIYKASNDIANKLLEKLGSRMKIHPARIEKESLQGCVSPEDAIANIYNVVASKVPAYSHGSSISRKSVFAMGVGDIRINVSGDGLVNLNNPMSCSDLNTRCEMPLMQNGDLRAEWNEKCVKTDPSTGKTTDIYYKVNWPFQFGNANPSNECDEPPKGMINRPGQDITPILTAAQYTPPEPWYIPESTKEKCVTNWIVVESGYRPLNDPYWKYWFATSGQLDNIAFSVSGDGLSNVIGDYSHWDRSSFDDPAPLYGRDGILQATGVSQTIDPDPKSRQVNLVSAGYIEDDTSTLCTEEVYHNTGGATSSKVFLIASLLPENDYSMGIAGTPTNNDMNVLFYNNLIMKNCQTLTGDIDGKGVVYQLGGWTGRTSFNDAYSPTKLVNNSEGYASSVWNDYDQKYYENVTYSHDTLSWKDENDSEISLSNANVIWIANPLYAPTVANGGVADLERIKIWLDDKNEGGIAQNNNRKVVITYGNTGACDTNGHWTDLSQDIADNVKTICDQLGLNSKPWYSDSQEEYLVQSSQTLEDFDPEHLRSAGQGIGHSPMDTLGDV